MDIAHKSFLEVIPIPIIIGYFITLIVIVYLYMQGKWKNNPKNFLIVFILGFSTYYISELLSHYPYSDTFTIFDLWNNEYFLTSCTVNTAFLTYLAIVLYVFHFASQNWGKYSTIILGTVAIILGTALFQYMIGIFLIYYLLLFSAGTSEYIFYPTSTIILAYIYQDKPIKKCWPPYLIFFIVSFLAYYFGLAFSRYDRFPNYGLPLLNEGFILSVFRKILSHSLNFWILLSAFKYMKKNNEEHRIKYFPTKPITLIMLNIILYIPIHHIIHLMIFF